MPRLIPQRVKIGRDDKNNRSCPAHRAWVRRHYCSVPGCTMLPVECAHVRTGTDGATGLKPSDSWVISLCRVHHVEQHQLGEAAFEQKHDLDLIAIAKEFAKASPHRFKLAAGLSPHP
jgi:hypothetical protein